MKPQLLALALLAAAAPAPDTPCVTTAIAVPPPADAASDPTGAFPITYEASRTRFRAACAEAVAHETGFCRAWPLPGSPDLTIDLAYVTRHQPKLLVLQSGLHGAEAFAGAAIQDKVFRTRLTSYLGGFDVLLIHAANPWGFAHVRRVDQCNVDLNRNFSADGTLYATAQNPAYDRFRYLTESAEPVDDGVTVESTILAIRTAFAVAKSGFDATAVAQGTHAGQYDNPVGFEFGGARPEPQSRFLREQLGPLIEAHPGGVYFMDLHTGLGPPNTLTVYNGAGWSPERQTALKSFVAGLPGTRAQDPSESSFQTQGDVIDFVPRLVPSIPVVALTLEWGTVGETNTAELATNARMILEHRAYFHGCASASTCVKIRADFAALFNPADPSWQAAVLDQSTHFLDKLVADGPNLAAP